ncbi:xylulose 5-phosphate 3-epimerase [Gilliamella apicola]|uniref:L-ribulose-5-phosphate 3-epimerase n=1 Tax=Gilliamella apicola TaxID=1196095 RepID=UPI000A34D419|nr:L-ribulose-5-phosphate 3-epimerase [Gilliamella apicola]OTQ02000.1 xylulose 5-phosphate 3-epimerase [Gilliamella apicola]OTQ23713.1 xylulose 5-phosphate 3-epimerase [Gilliamella apicola]
MTNNTINITRQTPCMGIYEKALPNTLSWQQKMLEAKSLGFDFIELSIDESDERQARLDWSDEEIYSLRHLCEENGVFFHSICLSAHRKYPFGSADATIREHAKSIMCKAITLAYKLGVRVIQLAGYDVYYEPANLQTHQRFIAGMQWCAKQAEKAGVMLAVEIMDTNYLNSLSKFEILKAEINSPYFMAYPDVGNISGWNYDVSTELLLSRNHIVQIHLKDTYKVKPNYAGQFRDLVIGEGEVDFSAVFRTLKSIDYCAPLVIEMWAKDNQWKENIITAQQRLKSIAGQADFPLFNA